MALNSSEGLLQFVMLGLNIPKSNYGLNKFNEQEQGLCSLMFALIIHVAMVFAYKFMTQK